VGFTEGGPQWDKLTTGEKCSDLPAREEDTEQSIVDIRQCQKKSVRKFSGERIVPPTQSWLLKGGGPAVRARDSTREENGGCFRRRLREDMKENKGARNLSPVGR